MQSKTRHRSYAAVAAMILTAALAMGAAKPQIPFNGTFQGHDTDLGGSETAFVVATSGTGIGSHLGQFSFTQEATVNFTNGTNYGAAHFVAANGDIINTTFTGAGAPTDNGLLRITEIHTITGGTGRFAGENGSFTVDRLASGTTFMTSGSFHGAISSPGADH